MDTSTPGLRDRGCSCPANALARRWAPLSSSYHATGQAIAFDLRRVATSGRAEVIPTHRIQSGESRRASPDVQAGRLERWSAATPAREQRSQSANQQERRQRRRRGGERSPPHGVASFGARPKRVQQRSTKRRGQRDFVGDAAFECANATAGISSRPCHRSHEQHHRSNARACSDQSGQPTGQGFPRPVAMPHGYSAG
jgi:hypothetical protein